VVLGELPALEVALVGADATARAVIAAKGERLCALGPADRDLAVTTLRAFAAADLNVARAAATLHLHPNSVRHRLGRIAAATGHDPRTFRGLVDLLCEIESP
jgi:sugar diacid utilization regulator